MQKRPNKDIVRYHRGDRIRVPSHPPEFMSRPWYNLVLRIEDPGTTLSLAAIRSALLTQLGFGASTTSASIRLNSVRAWGPVPVPPNPVVMIVYDPFIDDSLSANNSILEQITDYPDGVNRACVGYRYSTASFQRSIITSTATTKNMFAFSGMPTGSIVYLDILWRVYNSTPSTLVDDLTDAFVAL